MNKIAVAAVGYSLRAYKWDTELCNVQSLVINFVVILILSNGAMRVDFDAKTCMI